MLRRPCNRCGLPRTGRGCAGCGRPSTTSGRGYGAEHQQARRDLEATLPARCGYGCGTLLRKGGPWVAAHVEDGNPAAGWLASCRSCNERAKTRRVGRKFTT